jgi:hypothetical protein
MNACVVLGGLLIGCVALGCEPEADPEDGTGGTIGPGGSAGSAGSGGSAGSAGSGGGTTTAAIPGPASCELGGTDRLPIADTYITGDGPEADRMLADTNFGNAQNLLTRTTTNLGFTRKTYMVFDLSDRSTAVTNAILVLTLERHVEGPTPEQSGPQPFNLYGIGDNDDWDPATLPETSITWNNAPRNLDDWRIPFDPEVRLLIAGYDFMLGGEFDEDKDGVDDPGTRYAFDLTEYVNDRISNDLDLKITVLIAHHNPDGLNVNTSTFFSKEHGGDECNRPFLRLQ